GRRPAGRRAGSHGRGLRLLGVQGRHPLRPDPADPVLHAARPVRRPLDGAGMSMRGRSFAGLGILALALAVAPFLVPNSYYLDLVIRMCINAVIVLSLNLLIGYAGQISLGHAGFVGLGAYASAVLPAHFGWHPLLALVAGAAGTGLLALLVARRSEERRVGK